MGTVILCDLAYSIIMLSSLLLSLLVFVCLTCWRNVPVVIIHARHIVIHNVKCIIIVNYSRRIIMFTV